MLVHIFISSPASCTHIITLYCIFYFFILFYFIFLFYLFIYLFILFYLFLFIYYLFYLFIYFIICLFIFVHGFFAFCFFDSIQFHAFEFIQRFQFEQGCSNCLDRRFENTSSQVTTFVILVSLATVLLHSCHVKSRLLQYFKEAGCHATPAKVQLTVPFKLPNLPKPLNKKR